MLNEKTSESENFRSFDMLQVRKVNEIQKIGKWRTRWTKTKKFQNPKMSGVPKWYKYELDEIQKIGKGEMRVSTKNELKTA